MGVGSCLQDGDASCDAAAHTGPLLDAGGWLFLSLVPPGASPPSRCPLQALPGCGWSLAGPTWLRGHNTRRDLAFCVPPGACSSCASSGQHPALLLLHPGGALWPRSSVGACSTRAGTPEHAAFGAQRRTSCWHAALRGVSSVNICTVGYPRLWDRLQEVPCWQRFPNTRPGRQPARCERAGAGTGGRRGDACCGGSPGEGVLGSGLQCWALPDTAKGAAKGRGMMFVLETLRKLPLLETAVT